MQFELVKNDYLNYVKYEQAHAASTFTTYQSWLNRYQRFLADNGFKDPDVSQAIDVSILRKYLYHLSASKLRPRTLRAAFHPLRGLCQFLIFQQFLTEEANPMNKLTLPKKDAAVRNLVEDSEVCALFDACDKQLDPFDVARSRALLATMCYTGLRASEVVALRLKDISTESRTLLVASGKGGKARSLFPPPSFFTAYQAWIAERDKDKPEHDFVWTQNKSRHISDDWLRHHLEEIKAIGGLKGHENIKPHSLRHWFATMMLRNGATIKQIQIALGHSDVTTTATYLHINEQDCRAMAQLAEFDVSPGNNKQTTVTTDDVKVSQNVSANQSKPSRFTKTLTRGRTLTP